MYPQSKFDPDYLDKLRNELIPVLSKINHWVDIKTISENPDLFVDAVIWMAERGYFDDESGFIRIEFGKNEERIRWVSDREIKDIIELRKEMTII